MREILCQESQDYFDFVTNKIIKIVISTKNIDILALHTYCN